jgi:putative acetyltransferase
MMIRQATATDAAEIRAVVAAAFGQADEADLVEALRADGDALIELVAEDEDFIIGHILFSPLAASTGQRFAALAPLSVTPDRQKDGIGTMLMQVGHELCRKAGIEAVIVLGDTAYYPRVGYSSAAAEVVTSPFPGPHLMGLALTPGALDRPVTVTYAKAFGI